MRSLHPRIVLPMFWFTPEVLAQFLNDMRSDYPRRVVTGPAIQVSRANLPGKPEVVVLAPEPFP